MHIGQVLSHIFPQTDPLQPFSPMDTCSFTDPTRCGFPSFMLEFFVLASEFWFLCNGLDLYYSITNPFFSYNKRWVVAFVFSVVL